MHEIADSVKDKTQMVILEKLSNLVVKISFKPDIHYKVLDLRLLPFILKISGDNYSNIIRSNAMLAISLLTYNDKLFEQIIDIGMIDLIMGVCKGKQGIVYDVTFTQFSTLALVHFALNKRSIGILIKKGVL